MTISDIIGTKIIDTILPGYGTAFNIANKATKVLCGIVYLIVFILSIVMLVGSTYGTETSKGKTVISLTVITFILILAVPIMLKFKIINTPVKVTVYTLIIFILSLIISILSSQNNKELNNKGKMNLASQGSIGITTLTGLTLITIIILKMTYVIR